jgi:4-carboxymuconolactone decarboxylase
MSISSAARAYHDELFPGHVSTLAVTDPEFVEVFDNFAFDEVVAHGVLDTRQRMQVVLAALIALGATREYVVMLGAALEVGVTPVEAKEIVYHAVPYVGQGRVFDVLHATNDVLSARGVELPLPGQATTDPDTRRDAGRRLRTQIFGAATTDGAYDGAPTGQRHIQDFLSGHCFGDHWTRTGLDIPTRELLTFTMLCALGGCESQLRGHIRGNVNVGNDKTTLVAVVTQLVPWIGYPRSLNALAVLNEVLPEAAANQD